MAGLFVLGLAPRLILLAARHADLEFWEYETLARNIIAGDGYVISRFGHLALGFGDGNLYTFLTAALYLVTGHHPLVVAVIQALLAACVAPVIYVIGERSIGAIPAMLGAALAALHPGLMAYTLKLHPLGLDVLLLTLVVLWGGRATWTRQSGLTTALALGMSLMTRPTFFVACAAGLGARWLLRRQGLAATFGVVLLGAAIATPWIARNTVFIGRPVMITTSLEDVWKGNNPNANGSSLLTADKDMFASASPELQARFMAADELQLNDLFLQETAEFVRQQPGLFANLVGRKFMY
ncbi:MAG TPA: glycosyltransferase family 39 protein, partial [Chloroflexota bacterium]|nr:glycosyltransferase family 39 protein [Chloroflexota bacterium]